MDSMHDMQVRDEEARIDVDLVSPAKASSPLREKTTMHSQNSRGSKKPSLVLPLVAGDLPSTVPESPLKKKYKRNSVGAFKVAQFDLTVEHTVHTEDEQPRFEASRHQKVRDPLRSGY
jgi:hypothetical protein